MSKYAVPNFPALFTEAFDKLRDFDKKLIQSLGGFTLMLKGILDRGISFSDNVDCSFVDHTFGGTPNSEENIYHTLGKVPYGYIVVMKDRAVDVYSGGTEHTKTTLYLKSTVASAVIRVLVF
jgi:hypothetical protein